MDLIADVPYSCALFSSSGGWGFGGLQVKMEGDVEAGVRPYKKALLYRLALRGCYVQPGGGLTGRPCASTRWGALLGRREWEQLLG